MTTPNENLIRDVLAELADARAEIRANEAWMAQRISEAELRYGAAIEDAVRTALALTEDDWH